MFLWTCYFVFQFEDYVFKIWKQFKLIGLHKARAYNGLKMYPLRSSLLTTNIKVETANFYSFRYCQKAVRLWPTFVI